MQSISSPKNKKLKSKSHPAKEWQDIEVPTTGDSALTISSLSDVQIPATNPNGHHGLESSSSNNVTLSEPELRSSTPIQDGIHRFGENWYLRESPQYNHQGSGGSGSGGSNNGRRRVFNSLEGYELEISQDSGRQTVSRLHQMLQETDDRLERLQSEVHQVSRGEKE